MSIPGWIWSFARVELHDQMQWTASEWLLSGWLNGWASAPFAFQGLAGIVIAVRVVLFLRPIPQAAFSDFSQGFKR